MIKKIAIAVIVLIGGLLIYAATKPNTFHVERTASINASPEKIFPLINDLHNWGPWSPYEKKDPAMKKTYDGEAEGKGSAFEWEGNHEVGKGRVEITESDPPSKVVIKLDMIKPMEGHNVVEFTLQPQGDATNVKWAINCQSPYLAKVMSIFFNMDNMIGKDFETGLANLKVVAER